MVERKTGLGRGLTSLLAENLSDMDFTLNNDSQIKKIPIEKIQPGPWQARKLFDNEDLKDLSNSIISKGIVNPVLVTPSEKKDDSGFYLIAGERRWRAAQIAKIHEIPSIIITNINSTDASIISLIENVQRKNLNAIEEAKGFNEIINKYKYTQDKVSKTIGKSRVYITNSLRLLKLPQKIISFIENQEISPGHARLLIGREDALELALKIIKEKLSVRNLEKLLSKKSIKNNKLKINDPNLDSVSKNLSNLLGLKVNIEFKKKNEKAKINIYCNNLNQLNNLIKKIEKLGK
ncbi:MAG: ParB/RepB/Spo0J family partition protein [Candidatus Puniceispirillales bacterium]